MKQKFKLKSLGGVVVTMILSNDEKEIEAEATFGNAKDALKLLTESEKVESVELDPEQTEESATTFHFGKELIARSEEKKKDGIRVVKPIIQKE